MSKSKKIRTRKMRKTRRTKGQSLSRKRLGKGNFITRLTERPPPGGRFVYIDGQRFIDAADDEPRRNFFRRSRRNRGRNRGRDHVDVPAINFADIHVSDDETEQPRRPVSRATARAITQPTLQERTNDVVTTSIMPATAEILDSRAPRATAVLADTNNNVVAASDVSISTNPSGLSDRFIDSYIRQALRLRRSSAREKAELKRQLQNNIYYDPNWINPFTNEVEDDAGEQINAKVQHWAKYYDNTSNRSIVGINDDVSDPDDLAAFTQEDMMKPFWYGHTPEW